MPNEGGYIYGQDDNPKASQDKDKVVGKVDDFRGDSTQVDDCAVDEKTDYSDKTEPCD